ncbi:carotenoid ester lipase [Coprinopsis marcescibilis]|uniref:Carboxylic ester hydrolase n=1 Tax=Coprinopsis marcescibilis TaxID=230819 RepID=A0A5C3L515_COPMA|nr:carotenoid ester lipase [Coprinopsis marcescibilis]
MPSYFWSCLAFFLSALSLSSTGLAASDIVVLDNGTFIGHIGEDEVYASFQGIPFAQPPVANLRFRLPQSVSPYSGIHEARYPGPACPQRTLTLPIHEGLVADAVNYLVNTLLGASPDSEDCLTLTVTKPANANANSKLPVVVWIYGGGFYTGRSAVGGDTVTRSIRMYNPVVFVSMNYRLSGFGFMASKEVKAAGVGNLGLHDQREALRWVQKYIRNFGGGPTKVTIWGQSAGAISVASHMVAYGGDTRGLFRGAIMQSGAPFPAGNVTRGQPLYDFVVSDTGCAGSADTLDCLRKVPYKRLKASIDIAPDSVPFTGMRFPWIPRADGVMFSDNPQRLVQQGKVARVPYITGNCDDEGTSFAIFDLNVMQVPSTAQLTSTTESQMKEYIKTLSPGTTDVEVTRILQEYPSDVTRGSPFDTGLFNAITPQFKRLSALQGDAALQGPRRWLLDHTANRQDVWVYLSKRYKLLPILGSTHGTEQLNGGELQTYAIRFVNVLNPNVDSIFNYYWPKYQLDKREMMTFYDGIIFTLGISLDNYRASAMELLNQVLLRNPV